MTDNIVEVIAQYGLETITIAVLVNVLTGLIKMPIKYLANKTKHSTQITRFIVILPLLISFAITLCYMKFVAENFSFGKEFVTLWLTSSSLSLTIYAVVEKMIPSKKSILKNNENEMTEKIIDKLQAIADGVFNKESPTEQSEDDTVSAESQSENEIVSMDEQSKEEHQQDNMTGEHPSVEKIVLRGHADVQNDSKE